MRGKTIPTLSLIMSGKTSILPMSTLRLIVRQIVRQSRGERISHIIFRPRMFGWKRRMSR